jgi:hypothetical protein
VDVGLPELLLLSVIFAVICGAIAHRKGRSVAGWGALGLIFWFIPLIVVAVLPPARSRTAAV